MAQPKISSAELDVMRVLWATPGLAASEVHDALCGQKDWTQRTVKTLLARLVEKGALETRADGRRFLYLPIMEESDFVADVTGQFVDRVFSGRASALVAYLADTRGLTEEDVEELEKLLGELKK